MFDVLPYSPGFLDLPKNIYKKENRMTLIIAEPPSDTQLDPITLLQSQASPIYCGICACPCLCPRLPTPQPEQPDLPLTKLAHQLTTPVWLHQYHNLQPSTGILPYPVPPADPRDAKNPHKRIVSIHLYCLRAVLGVVKSGMFNCGSVHEEQMMIGYSMPRYVGFGPWTPAGMRSAERPESTWMGMADQRSRWDVIEGSHLRSVSQATLRGIRLIRSLIYKVLLPLTILSTTPCSPLPHKWSKVNHHPSNPSLHT